MISKKIQDTHPTVATTEVKAHHLARRCIAFVVVAVMAALTLVGSAPAASASVDGTCRHTHLNFNNGFSTYWTAEGVGAVGWRLYADLDVYDLCDHGGITGTVGVYAANVSSKGGSYRVGPLAYSRSKSSTWSSENLSLHYWYSGSGWDMFYVGLDNNVGMTKSTYFDYIKLPSYLVFGGVAGASRNETCTRGSGWACTGHLGL